MTDQVKLSVEQLGLEPETFRGIIQFLFQLDESFNNLMFSDIISINWLNPLENNTPEIRVNCALTGMSYVFAPEVKGALLQETIKSFSEFLKSQEYMASLWKANQVCSLDLDQ